MACADHLLEWRHQSSHGKSMRVSMIDDWKTVSRVLTDRHGASGMRKAETSRVPKSISSIALASNCAQISNPTTTRPDAMCSRFSETKCLVLIGRDASCYPRALVMSCMGYTPRPREWTNVLRLLLLMAGCAVLLLPC